MKTNLILSKADVELLQQLIDSTVTPRLTPPQQDELRTLINRAQISDDASLLKKHVSLYDAVTLVNPEDPSDWYQMEPVPPAEADLDEDRISVTCPMCQATLGRRMDDTVTWETANGERSMTITAIRKRALIAS